MKTMRFFQFFVTLALVLMTLSPISVNAQSPQVLYAVQGGQTSGACDSWANACELQYALTSAVSGQEIWVAAGVYKPTFDPTYRTATFQLKSGVGLYGGFAGTETARDQRDWEINKTILSGDIDSNDINDDGNFIAETTADIQGENAYHVVMGSYTDNTAVLDGFVVTAGQADNNNEYPNYIGGGMFNYEGNSTLKNVIFSANLATYGGGMYNYYYSNPILRNITFSANSSGTGGGMQNNYYSNPNLMNVTFSNNTASTEGGGGGGGMYNAYSSPTLTNVTFSNNTVYEGGGIYNFYSNPTLVNSILWGNRALNGPEIYNYSSAPIVTDSDVQGGWPGTGNIDADPLFVDVANGDLHLQVGSPAIDSGTNDGCPATDFDGITRPQDGNGDGIYICDMGAYEVEGEPGTPPANDNFADAAIIDTLPFSDSVNNVFATVETDEPQYCDYSPRTVWYKFTPTANVEVSINSEGSSFGDTVLSVYEQTGSGFGGLSHLNCVSWGGSFTFSAQEGMTYYIQAGSINSFGGELHVNLQEVFPPPNDNFANAISMSPLPFSYTVDTTWATVEPDESQYCDYSPRTVWYTFTPTANIEVRVTSEGSPFSDVVLTAYRDTGGGLVGLEAFTCVSWGGSLTFAVEQGVTYYIQAGYIYNSGELQVNLQEVPPPANDNFADATVISPPLPFDETVDTAGATAEAGEPLSSCAGYGGPYKSIWYAYTPVTSGVISATVPNAVFAPVLAVYTGNAMDALTELGCQVFSGNPVNVPVEAGTTYYFQVSKYTSWDPDGSVQFQLRELNPPPNDNFNNATAIGTLPFNNTVDITDATTEPGEPQYCYYSSRTVWYSFTPTENMLVQADMAGSSFGDTNFNVYQSTGPGFGGLNFMQCISYSSSATFRVQAGVTYYFQAGSISGSGGNLQFNLQQLPLPPNDDFANAKAITALPFSDTVDISNATRESNEPSYCYYSSKTVWYSFTSTENALVKVDMQGSSFWDSIFNVYQATGPNITDLSPVLCAGFGNSAIFTAQAGTTYYIQAGSYYGSGGNLQLNLVELPRPANDDFAKATLVSLPLPFDDTVDTQYASRQSGEPTPSCTGYGPGSWSVWYAFTPETSGSVSARIPSAVFTPVLAAYTGNSLNSLTQIGCQPYSNLLTFRANAGITYYFQVGNLSQYEQGGSMQFHLDVAPQPIAGFYYSPSDPSVFDTIQFYDASYDPGQAGIQSYAWDFGDGTTSTSSYPTHKYAKDGDYTVQLAITTVDGRTASISQVVHVKTHDVAITKLAAPNAASAGQTRTITVSLNSKTYPETVRVNLYKSIPGGLEFIGALIQVVPAYPTNRTTSFNFAYTFTTSDAAIGKVTFYAVATIVDARDSYSADNEAYSSPPTRVSRGR